MKRKTKRLTREKRVLRERVRRMTIVMLFSILILGGQIAILSATTTKDEPATKTFRVTGKVISMETEGKYDATYYHSLKLESEDAKVSLIVNVTVDKYTHYVKGDTIIGYITGESIQDMAFHTNGESSKVVWCEQK